jgi:arginase family enzyme
MTTRAIFFPFDLFGSPGTRSGAEMVADAFEEMLKDNRREKGATRARAYAGKVRFDDITFEKLADYEDWRAKARTRIHRAMQKNEFLLWMTGNHLGTLPLYEELGSAAKKTLVLQLDAHLDVYNLTDCLKEPSHGNFLMHADGPLPPIVNLGHRELLLRPEHIAKYFCANFSAAEFAIDGPGVFAKLRTLFDESERVFVDLDCDVFDPAFFPAVKEPRAFGLQPQILLQLLSMIGAERLAGVSISEFDPARDRDDLCLGTLVWLIEYVLLLKYE